MFGLGSRRTPDSFGARPASRPFLRRARIAIGLFAIALAPTAAHAQFENSPGAASPQWYSDGPLNRSIVCESVSGRERFCAAPIGGAVRVVRTLSSAPCVQGESWRWDVRGIYVRNGCRAQFAYRVNDPWGGGDWNDDGWGGNEGRYREIRCGAGPNQENFCAAPNDGRVRLVRQESRFECSEGRTWRAERGGVRVRNGCVGRFGYHESGDGGGWTPAQPMEIRCSSRNHRWAVCPVDIAGPVQLVRQDSHAPCERDWTWGVVGNEGIWVSDGCRARFRVNGRTSTRASSEGRGGAPPGVQRMEPKGRAGAQ